MSTFPTPSQVLKVVEALKPGESFTYYTGYMPNDLDRNKRKFSEAFILCSEHNVVHLTQRRLGDFNYDYIATRRPINKFPLELMRDIYGLEVAR